MNKISKISLSGFRLEKQHARERIALRHADTETAIRNNMPLVTEIEHFQLRDLDHIIKEGRHLTYEQAFVGMCYVLMATNHRFYSYLKRFVSRVMGAKFEHDRALASGTAFLQLMAAKESFSHLTAEEIAGMATAAMMDTVIRLKLDAVTETCGMGGDNGFGRNGVVCKTINVSTLMSFVLVGLGIKTVKHGSYGNTSSIGSTDSIELFGAKTAFETEHELLSVLKKSGFCYLDAHWAKTVHDLSHLLMMETVNHVIGPMTPPLDPQTTINKVIGVNRRVHPETMVKAYNILHARGKQRIGGIIADTGLSEEAPRGTSIGAQGVKKYSILDELSPFVSVVSLGYADTFLGTFVVSPEDFGTKIDPDAVRVKNNRVEIQQANYQAITGSNKHLSQYLAMNAALGLIAERYITRKDIIVRDRVNRVILSQAYVECLEVIQNGKAIYALKKFIKTSGGVFRNPSA